MSAPDGTKSRAEEPEVPDSLEKVDGPESLLTKEKHPGGEKGSEVTDRDDVTQVRSYQFV